MTVHSAYDAFYSGASLNSILVSLLPEELRAAPLDDIDCNGFLTKDQLLRLQEILAAVLTRTPSSQGRLVDFGCGSGGLLRYLAERLGCSACGIDISREAIARARASAGAECVEFKQCDLAATELEGQSATAIISLDAMYLAHDPRAALAEARRLLVPGGVLVFTTYFTQGVPGLAPLEWCAIAKSIGFEAVRCDDCTSYWRDIMRRKHQARLTSVEIVNKALGQRALPELEVSAAMVGVHGTAFVDLTTRHEIVAAAPGNNPRP